MNNSTNTSNKSISSISVGLLSRSVIDRVESLKNAEVDITGLIKTKIQIQLLVNLCNSKFMSDFPIEIVDIPIGNVYFGIKSWYVPDLKLSNALNFVIDTFEEVDRISDDNKSDCSTRCVDAILVLIQYVNLVIFSRFDHGLMIEEKKLDGLQSSNLVETSSQLVNGDDIYG